MDLTVSICTWNNSGRLTTTLDAISLCEIPEDLSWELVLVNNNCTDETDAVVEEFRDRLPLVYVHEPKPGLSRARNTGLAVASGELILFTDDDVKPWPGWVNAYWSAYQRKGSGFYFGGPIESEYEGTGLEPHLLPFAPRSVKGMNYGDCARTLSSEETFIGPNWACPAKALDLSGGFDAHKDLNPLSRRVHVGGETDLMNRLRDMQMSSWYVPEAGLAHYVPEKKCSLKHLADRAEAYEFNRARALYPKGQRRVTICGIPPVMYKWACGNWVRWLFAKVIRNKRYAQHYISLRRLLGTMRGLSEAR